ncbi:MAG: PaaI family thioesterase [Prevotella sp.]|nr:PaaI family thioesterase [Prevotella sp.]MDY2703972.1 PaaI family thioesterase [Prevotella sp.]
MRKIKNPWTGKEGYRCFGCSPDNEVGLKMQFYEDGDDVVCFWKPMERYQGWIDTLHGGIQSTLIDETAAWVVTRKMQTTGVTSKLEIRYLKPIMTTETQITIRGRIRQQQRNIVTIDLDITNAAGVVCTKGVATYFTFTKDKAAAMGFGECTLEGEEMLF